MSDPQVAGKVHLIDETKTFGQKGFKKRLVVLEQDKGRFVNYVPIEFTNDNCDKADALSVGQEVVVTYRLNGRKWQRDPASEVKFFVNLEALSVSPKGSAKGGSVAQPSSANDAFCEAGDDLTYSEEDIPF
jgi:hypothetical protein